MKISGLSGNVTDNLNAINYNNNRKFTTVDSDNDGWGSSNCASYFGGEGGWWYTQCSNVYLNGQYKFTKSGAEIGWDNYTAQPEFVEMKMRRNL